MSGDQSNGTTEPKASRDDAEDDEEGSSSEEVCEQDIQPGNSGLILKLQPRKSL